MDPLSSSIVLILGKYALDTGSDLVKALGPIAVGKGAEIVMSTLNRVGRDQAGQKALETFEQAPDDNADSLAQTVETVLATEPELAQKLETLLNEYQTEVEQYQAGANKAVQSTLKGSGAIAQGNGAVAAGKGGVAVGGNVSGGIRLNTKR